MRRRRPPHEHPRRAVVELVANAVSKPRDQVIVKVADGQKTFSDLAIEKAVYATGWDGTVVVEMTANGRTGRH